MRFFSAQGLIFFLYNRSIRCTLQGFFLYSHFFMVRYGTFGDHTTMVIYAFSELLMEQCLNVIMLPLLPSAKSP